MKLATLRNGTRDGALTLVSADLRTCLPVADIAPTMQAALDDWGRSEPLLRARADDLAAGRVRGVPEFDPKSCRAPPAPTSGSTARHT